MAVERHDKIDETSHRLREAFAMHVVDKGVWSRIFTKPLKSNIKKKTQQFNKKIGKRNEQATHRRETKPFNKDENMLSFTSSWGNTNQNNEAPLPFQPTGKNEAWHSEFWVWWGNGSSTYCYQSTWNSHFIFFNF